MELAELMVTVNGQQLREEVPAYARATRCPVLTWRYGAARCGESTFCQVSLLCVMLCAVSLCTHADGQRCASASASASVFVSASASASVSPQS
eukprot:1449507-Rhodomonas_salina.1